MKKILETLKQKWAEYIIEIFVVIIGILIAFGLNNWNESKKLMVQTEKERGDIINAIYSDLLVDQRNLDSVIKTFKAQHQNAISALQTLESDRTQLDTIKLFLIVDNLIKTARLDRKQNTFDGLVSLGKLELVKNDSLTNLLLDYYANYDYNITEFDKERNYKLVTIFIESFNSEDLIKIDKLTTSSNTSTRVKEWINNKDFIKMLSSLGAQAGAYSGFFGSVRNQLLKITEYMDIHYNNILD